ncbi:MAG: peptidylprolyl isomerase [Spirochaetes bacterium]|nr:peptidylprolyl isomerase [Spirochaetota bacterium]
MNIEKNKVVSINYTVKDDKGEVIDTSEGRKPLNYIHGLGYIVKGLENALEGKTVGDAISITVKPEDGYGVYSNDLIFKVEKEKFNQINNLTVGMQIQMQTENGPMIFSVAEIEDKTVTIDGNHPLAGKNLHFDVSVTSVREATQEELDHGHVH